MKLGVPRPQGVLGSAPRTTITERITVMHVQRRVCALAFGLLAGCGGVAEDLEISRSQVITGSDDRKEYYTFDATLQAQSGVVGCVTQASNLTDNGNGTFTVQNSPWWSRWNLCLNPPVAFSYEPAANRCTTGFLVAQDMILMDYSSRQNLGTLTNGRVVFGFRMDGQSQARTSVYSSEVFQTVSVVGENATQNWSLVRLDRPVYAKRPLPVRRTGVLAEYTSEYMLSHGASLPIKKDSASTGVRDLNALNFLTSNDGFWGSQGAPIINSVSGLVEGLYTFGQPEGGDYLWDNTNNCNVPRTSSATWLGSAQMSASFADFIPHVSSADAGSDHACAVMKDGSLRCWGGNYFGQLGDGTTTNRTTPVTVSSLTFVTDVVTGTDKFTCALAEPFRSVQCWGNNTYGQLGDGTTVSRSVPAQLPSFPVTVLHIAAGGDHACAIPEDGSVWCWGRNDLGQLGDNTTINRTQPVRALASGAADITAGQNHTCALMKDGTVQCWGYNVAGQIGDGTRTNRLAPTLVSGLSAMLEVKAGYWHTCARGQDRAVRCWGYNADGAVGDGTTTDRLSPVTVLQGSYEVDTHGRHTCSRGRDGNVSCWGANGTMQLGDNTTTNRLSPTPIAQPAGVSELALGDGFSCARNLDGTFWCWGANDVGQCGRNSVATPAVPAVTYGLTTIKAIAGGYNHTCAIMADGNTVKCWGYGGWGQLGDGTQNSRSTPANVISLPGAPKAIALGNSHSCALLGGGSFTCWGRANLGQLGYNFVTLPQLVTTPTSVTQINATEITAGDHHTCALIVDGTVKCWGYNYYGQVGDNTTTNRLTPTTVLEAGGGTLTNVKQISAGGSHTCALTTSGAVKCWGWNGGGQLGTGDTTNRYGAVTVFNAPNSTSVSAGNLHTCATHLTGARCWGSNSSGQLGDGTTTNRYAPVDVLYAGNNGTVEAGSSHNCFRFESGQVSCWGMNAFGAVGDRTFTDRPIMQDIAFNSPTVPAAGANLTCAMARDETAYCWGWNNYGQVGDRTTTNRNAPVAVLW